MKTRTMNCSSLQDIVRLGLMLIVAINVLATVAEGARNNLDYPFMRDFDIMPKPRSKPREIRGFKPPSMSTAYGFGKRQSNQLSKLNRHDTMIPPTLKDLPQRFPIEWFVKFLKMNPELDRKVERNMVVNEGRLSNAQRYRKNNSDDVTYYYDE